MTPKTSIFILLGGLIVFGLIVWIGMMFVIPQYPESEPIPTQPSGSQTTTPTPTQAKPKLFSVRGRDNSEIKMYSFGAESAQGYETYYFEPSNAAYSIGYTEGDDSFTLTLFGEPLATVRAAGEIYMMETLGLDEFDMCRLNYGVYVPIRVNEEFAGTNLGFSFCPGATTL